MLGTHFAAGYTEAIWNKLYCPRTDQSTPAGNWTSDPLITSPTPNQLSYFVPTIIDMFTCKLGSYNLTSGHKITWSPKTTINPFTAKAAFVQRARMQWLKTIETLSCWYSLESSQWVLSDEYPFAMVSVIFQLFCIILYLPNLPSAA